ncbi:MAG: histone deacetylase [Bdellovibrio sp.]|nr:histone deacetylase [Bdellovibrio sp.]
MFLGRESKRTRIIAIVGFILAFGLTYKLIFLTTPVSKDTAIVVNLESRNHDSLGHPESSLRIRAIVDELKKQNLWNSVERINGRKATNTELKLFHDFEYIQRVEAWSKKSSELRISKWSPYFKEASYLAASTAVGSLIELTEKVALGKYKNGFAIVRPPGHHATREKAIGFCIFNNVAIAAKNLIHKGLAQRVLIVDIDAHFGNGTADAALEESNIFYISLHQKYLKFKSMKDSGNSIGIDLNFQSNEKDYLKHLNSALEAMGQSNFHPDFVLVSAGYDAHWRDYMSVLNLSNEGYTEISKTLIQFASEKTQGKIVFSLEGGYDLQALGLGVSNTIKALLGRSDFIDNMGSLDQE